MPRRGNNTPGPHCPSGPSGHILPSPLSPKCLYIASRCPPRRAEALWASLSYALLCQYITPEGPEGASAYCTFRCWKAGGGSGTRIPLPLWGPFGHILRERVPKGDFLERQRGTCWQRQDVIAPKGPFGIYCRPLWGPKGGFQPTPPTSPKGGCLSALWAYIVGPFDSLLKTDKGEEAQKALKVNLLKPLQPLYMPKGVSFQTEKPKGARYICPKGPGF